LGFCDSVVSSSEIESSTQTENESTTPYYEPIETDPTTTSLESKKLDHETDSTENKLSADLNDSVMLQMCSQTISKVPKDTSLHLTLQLLCKLNTELSSLNNSTLTPTPKPLQTKSEDSSTPVKPKVTNSKKDQGDLGLELEDYDKQYPPKLDEYISLPNGTMIHINLPVTVKCYIFIRSIRDIDEINEVSKSSVTS